MILLTQNRNGYTDFLSKQKSSENPNIICCNFYRKLKQESKSLNVELEKVFGSDVELTGVEQESQKSEKAAIVLGVLLALSLIALITLVVVGVIK